MPKAPKGEYVGKTAVFSTRIRPDLRSKLEEATKVSGRSLSQEVEHRLRRSFVEDDKIADAFGDRRTYRLMRMMADAMHLSAGSQTDWLSNPFDFHIAISAALGVLEAVSPEGAMEEESYSDAASLGAITASVIWSKVQAASASIGLQKGTFADHVASIAKADLGDYLIERSIPAVRAKLFRKYHSVEDSEQRLQDFQEESDKERDQ